MAGVHLLKRGRRAEVVPAVVVHEQSGMGTGEAVRMGWQASEFVAGHFCCELISVVLPANHSSHVPSQSKHLSRQPVEFRKLVVPLGM